MSPSHPKVPLRPGQPKKRKETAVFVLCWQLDIGKCGRGGPWLVCAPAQPLYAPSPPPTTAGPCLTPPLATPAGYTPIPFAFLPLEHLQ
mgnify:CR=1 FL=1